MTEQCMWTMCKELANWQCNQVTRCRYDTILSECVDISKECFIDMDGLIAGGMKVSDAKSICISSQSGCNFKQQQNGGWKCVPRSCDQLGQTDCAAVPWRCEGNGKKGKKFECTETSK